MKTNILSCDTVTRWAFLAAVVVAVVLASSRGGEAVPTLIDIATDATDPFNLADTEPSIAVNPANPLEIAVVAFSGNWGPAVTGAQVNAPVWKSTDGGLTWTKVNQIPQPAPGFSGPGDRKVAFSSPGQIFTAELGAGSDLKDFVFRQTGLPNASLTAGGAYGDDQPHLDVDKNGAGPCFNRLYSPWLDFGAGNPRSTVSHSINSGVVMNDVPAGDNTFPNRTTRIAIAPDGKAYIIYKTREGAMPGGFENAHFRVARSDNCGVAWNALGAGGVSVHGAGAVQTWFTNNWGGPGKVARARSSDAWIAVDSGDGDVYGVHVSKDASGFGQIYVARSTNQGVNWTSNRVTDGTHHSAYPEIAVAANGAVGVLYIDFEVSGQSTIFRHRFARSFDNGVTWDDQILQSMDPNPLPNAASGFLWGDYEGLTAHGETFYGVFTGESIGRSTRQLDPIFFKETASQTSTAGFSYAAKCVCGLQKDPQDMRLARGFYATTINIHNPGDKDAKFFKKLALTFPPEEQKPGKIIRISDDLLKPDEALKVDCNEIRRKFFSNGFPAGYIEGFVIIESQESLDVTAVYSTASLDKEGNVTTHSSIDVEQIRERRAGSGVEQSPDLIPIPGPNNSFCHITPDGRLIVTVKNQGAGPAGSSTTRVSFAVGGTQTQPTPALAPGASVDLFFKIPANCFSRDCSFRITVDALLQVSETNEGNNTAAGTCIG
jgi:CARDB protein